jgi:hypothetical protein
MEDAVVDDDLGAKILTGVVQAISIDTNIFERAGHRLESGYLKHLEQFSEGNVRLVFSELTIGELRAHMIRKTDEALSTLRKGLADMGTYWLCSEEERSAAAKNLTNELGGGAKVDERIDGFLKRCNAIVLSATGTVDPSALVRAYLENHAPFEAAKKKHEFPDAIALMSLEAWARDQRTVVLFVTGDKGCQAFCHTSSSFVSCDNIEDALGHFQHKHERLIHPVATLAEEISRGQHRSLLSTIRIAVDKGIIDVNWVVLANSVLDNTNNQIVKVRVIDVAFDQEGGLPILQAVDRNEDFIVVRSKLAVIVQITCNFYFFVDDAEVEGGVKFGRSQKEVELGVSLDALCTYCVEESRLTRLDSVELVPAAKTINFGNVFPTLYD